MTGQAMPSSDISHQSRPRAFEHVIEEICNLNWKEISEEDLISVAWAYYYFSIQFRECLEIARELHPDDSRLLELDQGERDTDNLSPWPGIAQPGEKMNHDEFMRRTLTLSTMTEARRHEILAMGQEYLSKTRSLSKITRAMALASYEDGGLERVFSAMLTARHWSGPLLQAFKHFLSEHIRFDSDPNLGHGALCRHLTPDDSILPLWIEFKKMLIGAAPKLGPSLHTVA